MFYRSKKLKILISFISFFVIVTEEIFENFIKKKWITRYNSIKVKNIKALFSCNIKNHSILIFEPNPYHYECTPGYSKYFLDLGYNIDIIMQKIGEDAFCLFKDNEKIRLFIYDNLDKIIENSGKLSLVFHNYNYLLIESTDIDKKEFYKKLGFFKMNNSIFVFHNIFYIKEMGIPYYYYQNKIWSLAKFSNTLQVNPHYFGNIKLKQKNNKTRFFITSTLGRNNDYLISAAEKLKKRNFEFEIIVIGWSKSFSLENIPENLKNNFIFKYKVSYYELYQSVDSSDFIIINLDPNNNNDIEYKNLKATGSAQLSYGFLKPAIIDKNFASIYNMTMENSFIYDNSSFYKVIYDAININNSEYKKKQNNLMKLSNSIYNISLNNLKQTLKNISYIRK